MPHIIIQASVAALLFALLCVLTVLILQYKHNILKLKELKKKYIELENTKNGLVTEYKEIQQAPIGMFRLMRHDGPYNESYIAPRTETVLMHVKDFESYNKAEWFARYHQEEYGDDTLVIFDDEGLPKFNIG